MDTKSPEKANTVVKSDRRPSDPVHVTMFGDFTITCGQVCVSNAKSRSRKVWLLLAYLLFNRDRQISREELGRLLGESENNSGNGSALRMTRLRARRILEPLMDCVGQEMVLGKDGSIVWNPDIPLELDAERFEQLCRLAAEETNRERRVDLYRKALSLYNGDFLEKLSGEPWVQPLAMYYQGVYLDALEEALPLIQEVGSLKEVRQFCQRAAQFAPYEESLYAHQMRSLIAAEEYAAAEDIYQSLYQLLANDLGVTPSEELQELHMDALRHMAETTVSPDELLRSLREPDSPTSAMVCDLGTFRLFCQAEIRSASRRGEAVHIGLFSVEGKNGTALSRQLLNRGMEQLRQQLRHTLRVGDIISSCSASQYVVLLIQANYEDSQMVCGRVIRAFEKTYPRSRSAIRSTVLPLEARF